MPDFTVHLEQDVVDYLKGTGKSPQEALDEHFNTVLGKPNTRPQLQGKASEPLAKNSGTGHEDDEQQLKAKK